MYLSLVYKEVACVPPHLKLALAWDFIEIAEGLLKEWEAPEVRTLFILVSCILLFECFIRNMNQFSKRLYSQTKVKRYVIMKHSTLYLRIWPLSVFATRR